MAGGWRRLIPSACIVASSLGFSLQALLVQRLTSAGGLGTFQIIVFRGSTQALFCVLALAVSGAPAREWLGTSALHVKVLCLRSMLGFSGITFGFLAISMLPLGDASSLMQSAPIWSSLMAVAFLGERWHRVEILCALSALVGVALVMRPAPLAALLDGDAAPLAPLAEADDQRLLGSVCALCGAFSAGGVYVVVRWLGTVMTTRTPTVILYQALGQISLAPILVVASGQGWRAPTGGQWRELGAVGCLGFLSQYALTIGLKAEKTAVATPLKMTDVVFAFIWQATLVHHPPGEPRVASTSVAGACVILASMTANVCAKVSRDRGAARRELLPSGLPIASAASWEEASPTRAPKLAASPTHGDDAAGALGEGAASAARPLTVRAQVHDMLAYMRPPEGAARRPSGNRATTYLQLEPRGSAGAASEAPVPPTMAPAVDAYHYSV